MTRTVLHKDVATGWNWQPTRDVAWYASTQNGNSAAYYAAATRGHCGVENRVHDVLDVSMHEDASRVRKSPTILSILRSFALNILRFNKVYLRQRITISVLVVQTDQGDGKVDLTAAKIEDADQKSLVQIDSALAFDPDHLNALINAGILSAQMMGGGKHQEALGYFEKALAARPDSASARNNHATSLMVLGRLEEAVRELREVLVRDPG